MKNTLLASAGTLSDIEKLTSKFYCGMRVTIEMAAGHGFVRRHSDGKILEGVTICLKKGRYRLEMVSA